MAKQLTQQELQKIKDSVIASCVSKGIKPGSIMYNNCVKLGYEDAVKHANQGKLGLWFSKVDSFVQSQGGVTGLLQSVSSIANQYRGNTPNMPTDLSGDGSSQFPPGYDEAGMDTSGKGDNMGLWLVLIILLIVLIIASVIYFNKKKSVAA